MATERPDLSREGESGAALLLAIVLVFVLGVVFVALGSATSNDLLNSNNLTTVRSTEYAADGAMTIAIHSVRYGSNAYAKTMATNCLPSLNPETINGVTMYVYCTRISYQPFSPTRNILFEACMSSSPCTSSNTVIQAEVDFDDFDPNNNYQCFGATTTTCGTSMDVTSWIVTKVNG